MVRRFARHETRQVRSLDGVWDFAFLGDVDPDRVETAAIAFDDVMAVPGSFDATPAYAGRRGLAAYRTRVRVDRAGRQRLAFDAVHHWCRVLWNGAPVRDHAGGFTGFAADIAHTEAGWSELTVLVDNRFNDRSPMHLEFGDWYHFGGITRSVEAHHLGERWIDDLRVTTEDAAARRLRVRIEHRGAAGTVPFTVSVAGRTVVDETVELGGDGTLERVVEVPGAALWSPADPALHLLRVELGDDDRIERVGIREVTATDGTIAVNGEPLTLWGVNRHESHPQFGHAQPAALLVADVQQIKDLGCNFVRGSHYPQDQLFLDLCDENGICVWSESIAWQYPTALLTDPAFVDAQIAHVDEMVAAAANRPSVVLWGVLNESPSADAATRPAYERLLGRLRELDPSRPVTYASLQVFDDRCLDLADVIAVNTYPGWYDGGVADIPAALDRIAAHVDAAGHGDKPLIISEIGAGAVPGWRDPHHGMWTEEYQSELLETVIRHLREGQDRISGLSIWVLGDFRTTEEKEMLLKRPRSINDKGIVDEYRRPKLAFGTVRSLFREDG